MADYIQVQYNGKTNTTVSEYISDANNKVWNIEESAFLLYKDDYDISNLEKIYGAYDLILQEKYAADYAAGNLSVIVPNTDLCLPKANTDLGSLRLYGDNQYLKQEPFTTYWAKNYETMINSDGFVKVESLTLGGKGVDTQIINQNCRVWLWIRSVDKIINITPFLNSVNTSKGEGAGNFTINLDPVRQLEDVLFNGANIINHFNIEDSKGNHVMDYMSKKIQNNDLIFIRYEKLLMEQENELNFTNTENAFEISPSSLFGNSDDNFVRNWDMIGLVDSVRSSYSASSTDKYVSVSGRDLTKLLIEDASYFIPVKFIESSDKQFVWGGDSTDAWFKRNMVSGAYDYFFAYTMKDFKGALGFVLNHLSNLEIVPDSLFASYQNKSKVNVFPNDEGYSKEKEVKGVWQIIKTYIDPVLNDRRIADDSLINPDGTLYEYFKKLLQDPFVEFWGETNGDGFDLIVRQPPFTKAAIQGVVKDKHYIEIENKDVINYDFDYDDRYYSFYQIEPENTFLGEDKNSMLAYIPIVYFDQITKIFGNKRYVAKDNYISMRALSGGNSNLNFDIFISTLLPDYKFIIDINHYLPFTRKGTITLNGDRRIKRGTFVKLNATNELFYVTDVQNSLSIGKSKIDRTTTIQVERGMVFDYILGKFVEGVGVENEIENCNYFDIVDTELIYNTIIQNVQNTQGVEGVGKVQKEKVQTKFGINEDIFNFFLTRRQFD